MADKLKELRVIDSTLMQNCDCRGEEAPGFEYGGKRCPVELSDRLKNALGDFLRDRADGEGESRFYVFVLRQGRVWAVAIDSPEDLDKLEGPFLGYLIETFLSREDIESLGLTEDAMGEEAPKAGDWAGGGCSVFIPETAKAIELREGLVNAYIQGTKSYRELITREGIVKWRA